MHNKSFTTFTIGKLAKSAGVNIETIRYYQKIGLLKKPQKPSNGYRHYSPNNIKIINFIKRSQKLGFNLTEINELLLLGENNCNDICKCAKQKKIQIESQIKELQAQQNTLNELINSCHETSQFCPIIKTLSKN